jgi:tetraacyldisaccharide 4'-kinase
MSMLPDAESFRRLADGSARGLGPGLARLGLAALAVPYGVAVAARNAAYRRGLLTVTAAPVPVVSVGNLTLGGTGKTPLVAWLARRFCRQGLRTTIVSRGYGARRGDRSDESAELGILLPQVPHVADRDRVRGARAAAAAGAEIVVLDDGFQHRRLARDIDVLAVDATDPFGCGHLFPRGLLREPLSGITRANAVVLTRSGLVSAARRLEIRRSLEMACGGRMPAVWAEATHRPVGLRTAAGETRPLDVLRNSRVAAFAGIGNPAAFRALVEESSAELVGFRALADHHAYSSADVAALAAWARGLGAEMVVTTLKDLVKVRAERLESIPLAAVEIALEILVGEADLDALLLAAVPPDGPPTGPRPHDRDRASR